MLNRESTDPFKQRRTFLGDCLRTTLGVTAFSLAPVGTRTLAATTASACRATKAKSVIYIFLTGGLSQIDSFDPKPDHENQGPIRTIRTTNPEVQFSEFFPEMSKLADKLCLMRTIQSTQGAHDEGRYFMRTSYVPNETIKHPGLGSWCSHFLNRQNDFPSNIRIGEESAALGSGFLDSHHTPLPIINPELGLQNISSPKSLSSSREERRLSRLKRMNAEFANRNKSQTARAHVELFDEAVKLLKNKDLDAFDLTRVSDKKREKYGRNPLGQGLLLAKRLVEKGTTFVEVNDPGWDTHSQNFSRMNKKGTVLDQALSTLLQDLETSGLLDSTLVVLATEFGRTPTIVDERTGRDHFPKAFTCVLAGGGTKGGFVYGETDKTGMETLTRSVSVPEFNATIAHGIGLPLQKEVFSPSKRPFTVANKNEPVLEVYA